MGVTDGASGFHWASDLGFRVVQRMVLQELAVAAADRSLWDVPAPGGYRLVRWVNAAPENLLISFAHARTAIHDMPGGSSFRPPAWNPERVRNTEAILRQGCIEQRVVAAVHEQTGTVAGLTEIQLYPHRRDVAIQQDTVVLAGHRGHGLGRWMKAHMSTWLTAERPALEYFRTTTDVNNVHMIRVNSQLGYGITRTVITTELETSALREKLG
jgi:hypothetical protein